MSFSDYLNSLKIKIYNVLKKKNFYLAGPHDRPPVMYWTISWDYEWTHSFFFFVLTKVVESEHILKGSEKLFVSIPIIAK